MPGQAKLTHSAQHIGTIEPNVSVCSVQMHLIRSICSDTIHRKITTNGRHTDTHNCTRVLLCTSCTHCRRRAHIAHCMSMLFSLSFVVLFFSFCGLRVSVSFLFSVFRFEFWTFRATQHVWGRANAAEAWGERKTSSALVAFIIRSRFTPSSLTLASSFSILSFPLCLTSSAHTLCWCLFYFHLFLLFFFFSPRFISIRNWSNGIFIAVSRLIYVHYMKLDVKYEFASSQCSFAIYRTFRSHHARIAHNEMKTLWPKSSTSASSYHMKSIRSYDWPQTNMYVIIHAL